MTGGEFRSELTARLNRNGTRVLLRILRAGTPAVELTGDQILKHSERLAHSSTTAPGQVVLLLLPHSVELFLWHIGMVLTGRIPAIMPWPTTRVDPEKYHRNLAHQLQNLPASELITVPGIAANVRSQVPYLVTACGWAEDTPCGKALSTAFSLPADGSKRRQGLPLEDADTLFLQFSGGTTGAQKAVAVTASILDHQLSRLTEALDFSSEDTVVSWLPLYHDMGLIGCLWLPLWNASESVQCAASDWLLNPGLLFELLESHHGTFCWLPNFSFSYLARQRERMTSTHALAHVRGYINCSEPVQFRSLDTFVATFSDWGVNRRQMQSSYAMAENVFAVTQSRLGREPATVLRTEVMQENSPALLPFGLLDDVYVSSGAPLGGTQVRVLDAAGKLCREREAGEIQLFSESLFSGYWSSDGVRTAPRTKDGWYPTGDYGFLAKGELYVIGRLKDIVIVGGQNVFPEDIEGLANTVAGVYPGRVVAFGTNNSQGTESLVILAEMKSSYDRDRAVALEKEISSLVVSSIGIAPGRVCVLPERWIVKSTAGKISRRETRERYLRERDRLRQDVSAVEEIHR